MTSNTINDERRFLVAGLRCEQRSDGTRCLTGHAANFNVLSSDLGGWKERIKPGTFRRAISEKQDVRHTINHNPNLILGRTSAGTTTLSEDDKGLAFRTILPATTFATDLVQSVQRGDVNECSFTFRALGQKWLHEPDPQGKNKMLMVRELTDVDLTDISTVTYAAYPGTSTSVRSRVNAMWGMLFPNGAPIEVRSALRAARIAKKHKPRWTREDIIQDLLDEIDSDAEYQSAKDALNRLAL